MLLAPANSRSYVSSLFALSLVAFPCYESTGSPSTCLAVWLHYLFLSFTDFANCKCKCGYREKGTYLYYLINKRIYRNICSLYLFHYRSKDRSWRPSPETNQVKLSVGELSGSI